MEAFSEALEPRLRLTGEMSTLDKFKAFFEDRSLEKGTEVRGWTPMLTLCFGRVRMEQWYSGYSGTRLRTLSTGALQHMGYRHVIVALLPVVIPSWRCLSQPAHVSRVSRP